MNNRLMGGVEELKKKAVSPVPLSNILVVGLEVH